VIGEVNGDTVRVVELGGHKGELALSVFSHIPIFPFVKWLNLEIVRYESVEGLKHNYALYELTDQLWSGLLDINGCDLFVCSHTLEHFSDNDLNKLLLYLFMCNIKYLALSMPIKEEGQDWSGHYSSHLLGVGRRYIRSLLSSKYELLMEDDCWCSFWRLKE